MFHSQPLVCLVNASQTCWGVPGSSLSKVTSNCFMSAPSSLVSTPTTTGDRRNRQLGRDSFDARAEAAQARIDRLVAAIDVANVVDLARPVGADGGDQHRHAGADIGRRQALAAQA